MALAQALTMLESMPPAPMRNALLVVLRNEKRPVLIARALRVAVILAGWR